MEHFGEQYLVSSAGALQPTEALNVHGVMFKGMNSACVSVIPKNVVSSLFIVLVDDSGFKTPIELDAEDLIELRAGLDRSTPLVPCKWIVSRRVLKSKPNPVKTTGTWRHSEDGTLHAEQVMRVERVFVGSKYDDRGTLRVEVNRRLVVAEGPAELFHKTVDLPTTVLLSGQMIELVGENRRRIPCTWFVTELLPSMNPFPNVVDPPPWPVIEKKTRSTAALQLPKPKPKRSHIAKRMGAIDIPNGKCGKCDSCELERIGCGCDGALDDGCFLCHPEKHERPPCPGS